ncbi:ketopantoate reductase PanE/ApbA-domain-containing protein [Aspergillus pseudonomiae]|nr:ketopantoate reductase PanE/ApbA-domain-containing protein [Aspergillus pseudonomiae]
MGRHLTRLCLVGSNAISAFLSWRLQATTSCDVTLVWKSGYEAVSQYGVSFKSKAFGNERFKPRHVVRTPEDAASRENAFDYVILCVKALPDVYDLASVIESVVTPQHTCILVNTTNTLGVESHLEQRFPTNVVLSLVSGVEISQIGASEFEHLNSSEIWVGATNKQTSIPSTIQNDMAAALAMTLASGQVDCKVSENIRQEQFDRMIGPIAFYPTSVMFETSNHTQLLEKVGVRQLVSDIIEELLELARANGCSFPNDFAKKTIEMMTANGAPSTMYQDFQARRPMEIETYLGSPIKLATESGVRIPRIETLYAVLHHVNATNLSKPRTNESPPPVLAQPPPRMSSAPPRGPMNGPMRGGRAPSGMMPRRGPPHPGMSRPPSAQPQAARMPPRDASLEGLEEFSHLVMYDDAASAAAAAENGVPLQNGTNGYSDMPPGPPSSAADLALRERELAIRQRELQIREQEMGMRRGPRRPPPPPRSTFDEEDEDDYFDPMDTLPIPSIDPDQVDMLSITSRRTKKSALNASQLRKNPEITLNNGGGGGGGSSRPGSSFSRYFGGRKRTSDRIMQEIPGLHDSLMDNPMMAYSSNRYGAVDRNQMQAGSRANSLTASRMGDYPPHPYPTSRRNSQSPATPPYGPPGPRMGRPGTSQDPSLGPPNGPRGGQPSPPGQMRAPVPRHPPGQGNAVGPQQIEQQYGVSNPSLAKGTPKHRSLTGSASASAESGDSGASANLDSETSAHSSQISLNAQQAATPVR